MSLASIQTLERGLLEAIGLIDYRTEVFKKVHESSELETWHVTCCKSFYTVQ